MDVWRLQVLISGGQLWAVHGSEEVLEQAWQDALDILTQPDGTTPKVWIVHGMCDTADRAERRLAVKAEDLLAVDLVKEY